MDRRNKILRKFGFDTDRKTFIVAEIGINHGGNLDVAKELVDAAARAGVDAVKFQTFIAEKRAPKGNQSILNLLKECELPFVAFKELKDYCTRRKLIFFSTPFDEESVGYLESIDCEIYKVASFDVVNLKLLNRIAKTGKAVIMSTGMANLNELEKGFNILKKGTDSIALLHCISAYPTQREDANLGAIHTLLDKFDCVIGYSDHTKDTQIPLYAVAAGAQIIENHFMLDANMKCVDAPVSVTETQMKRIVTEIRKLEKIFGLGELGLRNAEEKTKVFRRHFREK